MIRSPASLPVHALTPNAVIPRWWRTGRHGERPSVTTSISSRVVTAYSLMGLPFRPRLAVEPEPRRELVDLRLHRLRDRARELHVLVARVDAQHASLAVGCCVELPDEAVAVQDRQCEIAPAP